MPIERPSPIRRSTERRNPVRRNVERKSVVRKTTHRRNIRRHRRDEIWPAFVIGLDVGQERDPSALAIVERVVFNQPVTGSDGHSQVEFEYRVRYLHSFELGTEYPDIADYVVALMNHPTLVD